MSNTKLSPEQAALKKMGKGPKEPVDQEEEVVEEINIQAGFALPDDFENPPCGEMGHYCINSRGVYDPEWIQLVIQSAYEGQANPQKFPLGGVTYIVPLDEWLDAPPCVKVSLDDAVETHHVKAPPNAGDIMLGKKTKHKKITRKRFVYQTMPSS